MFNKVRKNIVCLTVDAAVDEVLSGENMRSSDMSNTQTRVAPRLKYIIRDAAHASRRLGSRPAAADPYLKDVMTMLVNFEVFDE